MRTISGWGLVVLLVSFLAAPPVVADATVPALIQTLTNDPDPEAREEAAEELDDLEEAAAEAVPALIEALQKDRWPEVRQAAASALGDIGAAAAPAVPALYEAMKDPDGHVRVAARNALFRLDPDNKDEVVRLEDELDAAPPPGGASAELYQDVTGMADVLGAQLPVAAELTIYPTFATITAPDKSSPSGWGRFSYEKGRIAGPREGSVTCEKTFRITDIDLKLVPKLVEESLKRAGGDAEVKAVILGHGVFCKKPGWMVSIDNGANASMIEFKLNGKVARVIP